MFHIDWSNFCSDYDSKPNEILKSEVFRESRRLLQTAAPAEWIGTLRTISTNEGGSRATLVIRSRDSDFYDTNVKMDSPVYAAAAALAEGDRVAFSGGSLREFNLTERGKVCGPDFRIALSNLRPTAP